jgi:hypothetical protein
VRERFGIFATPRWNFYKYVVSRDGHLVGWYASATTPDSDKLVKAIEAELAKCAADPAHFIDTYCKILDNTTKSWLPFHLSSNSRARARGTRSFAHHRA